MYFFCVRSSSISGRRNGSFCPALIIGKAAAVPVEACQLAKSVYMSSFFHLLLFNASPWTAIVLALAGIFAMAALAIAWWRSRAWTSLPAVENWLWAATICLTLVV